MPSLSPTKGGCWFCSTDDDLPGGWLFCWEFDTNVHVACLKKEFVRRANGNGDQETDIILAEFKHMDIFQEAQGKKKIGRWLGFWKWVMDHSPACLAPWILGIGLCHWPHRVEAGCSSP